MKAFRALLLLLLQWFRWAEGFLKRVPDFNYTELIGKEELARVNNRSSEAFFLGFVVLPRK